MPSWFSVWLVSAVCPVTFIEKGVYLERSQQTDCNCFPCQKHRVLLKPWQLCLVMEKNLQQENKEAFIPITYVHSSSVHNLSIILKTVYIILNNSIRSNSIKAFLFFLFGFKKIMKMFVWWKKKIIINRLFPSLSGGKVTKRVVFQFS